MVEVRSRLHQQTALIPKSLASRHEWVSYKVKVDDKAGENYAQKRKEDAA